MGLRLHHCYKVGYLTGSLAPPDQYHKIYFAVNMFAKPSSNRYIEKQWGLNEPEAAVFWEVDHGF